MDDRLITTIYPRSTNVTETQLPPTPGPPDLKERWRQRYLAYREWFAEQPAHHLAATMAIGVLVTGVLFLAFRFVVWMIGGIIDWLFIADTPPPPPPPEPASEPSPLEIATQQLFDHVAGLINGWAADHVVAGVAPTMLVGMWLLIGAVLFVFALDYRKLAILWGAWMLSTLWVIWDATPDGNPVPVAMAAGLIAVLLCVLRVILGLLSGLLTAALPVKS